MGKTFTDASTTLTESNFNKLVTGDQTTGSNGYGIACWGAQVNFVSGTDFAIDSEVGAKNIVGDLVVSWTGAATYMVLVDYSAISHWFEVTDYEPVVIANQHYSLTNPYHIVVYPDAANKRVGFRFYSMGASPALITTPDSSMKFHFLVWGYING